MQRAGYSNPRRVLQRTLACASRERRVRVKQAQSPTGIANAAACRTAQATLPLVCPLPRAEAREALRRCKARLETSTRGRYEVKALTGRVGEQLLRRVQAEPVSREVERGGLLEPHGASRKVEPTPRDRTGNFGAQQRCEASSHAATDVPPTPLRTKVPVSRAPLPLCHSVV